MAEHVKTQRRFARVGHFISVVLTALVLVTVMLLLAAALFEYDPDGHQVSDWLYAGRYWLFAWRLMIYAGLSWFWFALVRPKLVNRSAGKSLRRLEWMVAVFILIIEFVAWHSVAA
jgi:hypothetical protein